jgi:hypothetical protein
LIFPPSVAPLNLAITEVASVIARMSSQRRFFLDDATEAVGVVELARMLEAKT